MSTVVAFRENLDPDVELIDAVRRGDRSAYERFVRRYDPWVRGVVYGVLRSRHGVDDVIQQVWINLWTKIPELRVHQSWRPWLYRMAHNAALDAVRRQGAPQPVFVGDTDRLAMLSEKQPRTRGPSTDDYEVVLDAIASLPALYREPFVLRHLSDWTYQQIAEVMDLPVDTVETRLVRARRLLRQALGGRIGLESDHEPRST